MDTQTDSNEKQQERAPLRVDEMADMLESIESSTDAPDEKRRRLEESVGPIISTNQPAKGKIVAQKLFDLADELDSEVGRIYGLGYLGFANYLLSNHERALKQLLEALGRMERAGFTEKRVDLLGGVSGCYLSLGEYEKSLEYGFKALKECQESGNDVQIAWSLYSIGVGFQEIGDSQQALDYHTRARDHFGRAKETDDLMGTSVRATIGYGRTLVGMATAYQSQKQYSKALENQIQALELFRETDNLVGASRSLNDLGSICQELGEYEKAMEYLEESLRLRRQVQNRQAQSTTLINMGRLYTQMGLPKNAIEVLEESMAIAEEIKTKPRIFQTHQALSEAWELAGDSSRALEHFKAFHAVRSEVLSDETAVRLKNVHIGHEIEKSQQEAEIERLKNVELKEKNDQLAMLLNELKSTQSRLIQQEKMAALGSLVASVVHELNSPVGTMVSSRDVTVRSVEKIVAALDDGGDSSQIDRAVKALNSSNGVTEEALERIVRIVESLKGFVRLDEAGFQCVDIRLGIDAALTLLQTKLAGRIKVHKEFNEIPKVPCYPGELNQVFMNLLTNAVEAIDGSGEITIRTSQVGREVQVEFVDSGAGIHQEQMKTLFDPSFSKKGSRVKAGMGLFTSFNIVQNHEGRIEVDSNPGEGSRFTVILPIQRSSTQ